MKARAHRLLALLLMVFALHTASAAGRNPDKKKPAEDNMVVALEKFAYSVYSIKDQLKFRLAFENESAQQVWVRIFDSKSRLLFTDHLGKKTALKRNYDVAGVGKGEYRMVISCGQFNSSNQLFIGINPVQGKFEAHLSHGLKAGKMQIAFQNATDDVYVTLSDASGVIHYSEHLVGEANFARRYDLSRLRPGQYTMSLSTGDKTLEQIYQVGK